MTYIILCLHTFHNHRHPGNTSFAQGVIHPFKQRPGITAHLRIQALHEFPSKWECGIVGQNMNG